MEVIEMFSDYFLMQMLWFFGNEEKKTRNGITHK